MPQVPVSKGFTGLRTKIDQASSRQTESGSVDLAYCSNVDIDDEERLSVRRGRTEFYSESLGRVHSCFSTDKLFFILFCEGDALSVYDILNHSVERIRNINPGRPMAYELVDDTVYYTNGLDQGRFDIPTRTNRPWIIESEYSGPVTTKEMSNPPLGTDLLYYRGRMYVKSGKALLYSMPFDTTRFILDENNILMTSEVSMMASATDCLIISDQDTLFSYQGSGPIDFEVHEIYNAPGIMGTAQEIHPHSLGLDGTVPGVIMLTTSGVIFISNLGEVTQITESKIDIPRVSSLRGSSTLFNGKYICQCDTNNY